MFHNMQGIMLNDLSSYFDLEEKNGAMEPSSVGGWIGYEGHE